MFESVRCTHKFVCSCKGEGFRFCNIPLPNLVRNMRKYTGWGGGDRKSSGKEGSPPLENFEFPCATK